MQPYNENKFYQDDKVLNSEPQADTETNTNIGTWILICIILALINVILGLL